MAGGEAFKRATGPDQRFNQRDTALSPRAETNTGTAFARQVPFARQRSRPHIMITLASGTQSYAIHPALWIGGALLAVSLAIVGIASGLYVAFHDNILEIAVVRPIRMEQAYEDRIAALRQEIDRINSRQLLDQDAFETKIDRLMGRQDELKAQEARVIGLLNKAQAQGIRPPNSQDISSPSRQLGADLAPPSSTSSFVSPQPFAPVKKPPAPSLLPPSIEETPLRSSWLTGGGLDTPAQPLGNSRTRDRSAPAARLARVEADLNRMKSDQMLAIASVTGLAETHSKTIERVVGRLGLRMAQPDSSAPFPRPRPGDRQATPEAGVGGPLVPIVDEAQVLARAETALTRLNQLQRGIGLLPLGQPISGAIEVTSPFGERPDPFLGILAMHTGVDFRAAYGDPVVATAAGVVTEASRQGGYGNMVEIDHGNGIATRYGHMSHFVVTAGQKIRAGQILGYVGSTGRSTAPHLHYETRVAGVPVNPQSYLEAGNQLRPLLN